MKFKVTKKDFMLFCIYCGILLYFCAIAVLNFSSFSTDGTFYGLLPFKAFTPQYIGFTLGLFVAALILIFTSVSSKIFSKEKGDGFGLFFSEKSSDGYSKWASDKDIKTDKNIVKVRTIDDHIEAAGVALVNNGKEMWVDNGEYHNLIIGSTGSGKTECVVKPLVNLLSKKGESMVITDPKGEIYQYCGEYLKKQGYNIVILNFRDPEKGNSWNPLALPYMYYKQGNQDKATELLEDVSLNILYDKSEGGDSAFWQKSAADYFSGLTMGLFMDAKEKEVNLNSINFMSTVGEERRGTKTYIQEYFNLKGEASPAYIFASNTINAPNETKGGILSTFRQKIRLFSTKENLSEMLSYSDFDMRDIGNKKTAVFMIIHDEKKTYHGLMTIFIKQCYETLIDCAQANGGKLTYRTNFILDEFANMPPLKDVDSMVTAARSRSIRFSFIIQNFAQLNDVYGEEVAQVIKGNCGNLIYLISTELKALEEISKMCGEVKSKEKDKTASTPLVTVSDLQKLKLFQAIIIRWRKNPFKTDLAPDFKIDWGIERKDAVLPTREKTQIELFDVKKFVSEKKKEEAMNNPGMMGGMDNPFMGGGGFNPFMGANPFMGPRPNSSPMTSNPTSTPNPFMGGGEVTSKDIDDMVKEIEKKLQALDEEEKKENELKKQSENITEDKPVIKPIVEKEPSEDIDEIIKKLEKTEVPENNDEPDGFTQEINLKDEPNTMLNVDKDSEVINNSVSDDDDYLDDFFDD
ncbi:MAG: type IV secretory system conjugative DNA transfer family protein [Bacilli bacterium]|nr:type IV secretory system conjugative DNA transfer family protein [Bacilli bacterium]